METLRLKAFVEVVRQGSVSEAAKVMGYQKSHVSRLVSNLEAELGFDLFIRQGKKFVPTPRGNYFYKTADRLLYDLEQACTAMNEWEGQAKGYLKVLTTPGTMNTWLVHHMREFTDTYPDIHIRMIATDNNFDLEANGADVAVLPYINGRPDLIQEHLFTYNLKLYASKEYLERFGHPETFADLDHHRIIAFYDNDRGHMGKLGDVDWALTAGMPAGKKRTPFIQLSSAIALHYAAMQGIGIVPATLDYGIYNSSGLVNLFPKHSGQPITLYYTYPRAMKESPRVQTFGNFFKNICHKIRMDLVMKKEIVRTIPFNKNT